MSFRIKTGDVRVVLSQQDANSYDACLTDPPYGLGFMGREWDHGVPNKHTWKHVYRVLKPGAFLLAFGGTRTWHRLACAIEEAGFEIRDCIMWLYGSGFPKSMDIGKKIEAWAGYGTALKPAWEPVIVAMKPCEGNFASNALKYGVAGLNIDGGRIGYTKDVPHSPSQHRDVWTHGKYKAEDGSASGFNPNIGRWPANLILDPESGRLLDAQTGILAAGGQVRGTEFSTSTNGIYGRFNKRSILTHNDAGGASRFFYCAKASMKERNEGLQWKKAVRVKDGRHSEIDNAYQRGESQRFNTHPTVKPIALARYLAKLILPPYQGEPRRLLVPFCGSGSEMMGARDAGWKNCLGVEIDPEYAAIAQRRLTGNWRRLV